MDKQGKAADYSGKGRTLLAALFVAGWALLALLGTPPPSAVAACANETIRAEQGAAVLALPECMALEQVSPAKKGNQLAGSPARITADGSRLVFNSIATLGSCPNVNGIGGDLFVAGRGAAGWETGCANLPYGSGSGLPQYSFTPDLSSWLQTVEDSEGVFRFLREGPGGSFTVLSPSLEDPTELNRYPRFQGASADQSHVYFKPAGVNRNGYFIAGDPQPEGVGEDSNAYVTQLDEGGAPQLGLLARDRNGKVWGGKCGARLGGMESSFAGGNLNLKNGNRNQGAIAADGSYVYFSTRPGQPAVGSCTEANKKRIMAREETPTGPLISELFASECTRVVPALPCSSVDGDDAYQGASVDQTKVYFTTTRQLANTDLDSGAASCDVASAVAGCDLYLYDASKSAGQRLTQVSAGEPSDPTPGSEAKVYNSIAAISADGSRVYFVAQGILTTDPSPKGATAIAGQPNLYTWSAKTADTAFIGTLAGGDGGSGSGGLWGSEGTWNNGAYPVPIGGKDGLGEEVGGDGHILLFKSSAPLSADDTDGGFRDVFRYNADSGELARISKGGPGGSDNGAFNASPAFGNPAGDAIPGTDYAAIGRPISEDGQTIELTTTEPLLPGDPSGVEGVYLWKGGQVYRLPGSTQAKNTSSNTPSLSADGSTLAYHTTAQLLPSDGDSALDVYVARAGGGYTLPIPPEPCQIDESKPGRRCPEPPKPTPPENPPGAPINPRGNFAKKHPCPKNKVRKHGKCVKKPHKKHHKKKHHRQARRAGAGQGGQK